MSATEEAKTDKVLEDVHRILEEEEDLETRKKFVRSVVEVITTRFGSASNFEEICSLAFHAAANKARTRLKAEDSENQEVENSIVPAPPRVEITTDTYTDNLMNEPWMWCISLSQLKAIAKSAENLHGKKWYEKANMYQIVEEIIVPICKRTKKGYWASQNPKGLKVTVFVTHSWKENFKEMVDSVSNVFKNSLQEPHLWICAFALVQGDYNVIKDQVSGKDSSLRASPFVQALKRADFFLVVRNSFGDLYTRIWCVCELMFAMEFGLVPQRTYITGPDDFADSTSGCMEAEASVKEDKERILQHLTSKMSAEEVDGKIAEFRQMKIPTQTNFARHLKFFIGFLLFIMVAAAVTVTIVFTRSSDEEKIRNIIESELESKIDEDYQIEAFHWVVDTYKEMGRKIKKSMEQEILLKYSLSTLYYSTAGSGWNNKLKWESNDSECNWYGIRCSNESEIIEISLPNNNLKNTIPSEIRFLRNLEFLDISSNDVKVVATELASLPSLKSLWLIENKNMTEIPKEVDEIIISNQKKYSDLILGKFPMANMTIFNYGKPRYRSLQISAYFFEENNITWNEDDFLNRYALTLFYYSTDGEYGWERNDNWLLKPDYCSWNWVEEQVSSDSLHGVFCDNKDNKEVESLILAGNRLRGSIPNELTILTSLKELRLNRNKLSGEIPSDIGSMTSLTYLSLSPNQLRGKIPNEIRALTSLTSLSLSINQLRGEIPNEIKALTSLTSLSLFSNQLTGEIPSEIGSISALKSLDLMNNKLTGKIPTEVGAMTLLRGLKLGYNGLNGEIPSEVGALTLLSELTLYNNQLTGRIPSELVMLTLLKSLSLYKNRLSGEIPSEVGVMTSLVQLNLWNNTLTGKIPSEVGKMTSLTSLSLNYNHLTGKIPSEVGVMTSLVQLNLWNNKFTGKIPSEVGTMTSLTSLSLNYNNLTGKIPSEVGMLTKLKELYLTSNQLTGKIPSEIGALTSLKKLYLDGTQLTGEIPSEFGALNLLEKLYLNSIHLEETFEVDNSIPSVNELNLTRNQFD